MAQEQAKIRQSNMELLRIIAMLMIITLHYLDKGGVLSEFDEMTALNHYLTWFIESLCYVSVNVYVLISGYFLISSKFTFKKLFLVWAQIIFYSWIIAGVCLGLGLQDKGVGGLYELIFVLCPVTSGHYWFATIYILLFLIFPFLNIGIKNMKKEHHRTCIVVLLVIFSFWNTVLPMTMPATDYKGMDIAWFVCLYFIAAYIRKYPETIKWKGYIYLVFYILCCAVTFGGGVFLLYIDKITGKLGGYATNWYAYNSFPVLVGSVCLFLCFLKINIKGMTLRRIINTVAGATFGVYLIHEHRYIRYLWPEWIKASENASKPYMVLHLIGSVFIVFMVCTIIELIRKGIFMLLTDRKWFDRLFCPFSKIEAGINGEKQDNERSS